MITVERIVRCDYRPRGRLDPLSRCFEWVMVETASNDRARVFAAENGWRHRSAPTRHEYDLCPDHAELRPGVDFPNWRAG